jgi:hypothetical protein
MDKLKTSLLKLTTCVSRVYLFLQALPVCANEV